MVREAWRTPDFKQNLSAPGCVHCKIQKAVLCKKSLAGLLTFRDSRLTPFHRPSQRGSQPLFGQ